MYIETERLIIRSLESTDEQAYIEMASDGSLHDIFGDCRDCHKWIGSWIREAQALEREDRPDREYLAYAVAEKQTGALLGSVGCSYYEDRKQTGMCYFIGAQYRGQGYAAEAAAAYAAYFFSHYDMQKMIAPIRDANPASWKTIEKIGFILTGAKMYQDINDDKEQLYRFYELINPVSRALTHWGLQDCKAVRIYDTAWQVGEEYVLKVYYDLKMLKRNLKMLHLLSELDIPVGQIVPTQDNASYVSLDKAFHFLSKKLPGSKITRMDRHPNLALQMGEIIAKLHVAFKKCETLDDIWDNSLLDEMNGWVRERLKASGWMCISEIEYEKTVSQLADLYAELPVQLIHRDIHFGNFLFVDGSFSGYIDFDLSQRNIRIFDICYFLLGLLCQQEDFKITEEEWLAFLRDVVLGYEKVLKLSGAEKKAIPCVMECIELLFAAYFEETDEPGCAADACKIYEFIKERESSIIHLLNSCDRITSICH